MTNSDPRVRLKARVARLKARVGRLKARAEAIKPKVKKKILSSKILNLTILQYQMKLFWQLSRSFSLQK